MLLLLPSSLQLATGIIVIVGLALLSVRLHVLDVSGALTGALISSASLLAGGLSWLVVIIAFVLLGSLLTRFRYQYKQKLGSAQEKGGRRSWPNAIANGLVGGIIALAEIVSHHQVFAVAYLASISAAMSDTIATEIGLLSHSKPRLIYNPARIVSPGVSGGVSGQGELAGMVSALGLGAFGIAIGVVSVNSSLIWVALASVVIASFVAMNFDSLLGATIQGVNRCVVCNETTESLYHHAKRTTTEKGIRYLENNMVNLICTVVAAAIAASIYLVLVP